MALPVRDAMAGDTDAPDARLRSRLMALAAGATVETSTRNLAEPAGYADFLRAGSDVYVTWLPGMPWHHLVSVARRLASRDQAIELLASLRDQAGVTRALLIGGDQPQPLGPFADTLAVLRSGLLQAHGICRIGLGGFPEGHPRVSPERLEASLDQRLACARTDGMDAFLVTQFCFDGHLIHRWLARLRQRGITVPVRIGLAGPARLGALLRFAATCGVGASLRTLGGHAVSLTRLARHTGPESVAHEFAVAESPQPDAAVEGFHLFSFGGVESCARWSRALAEGRFRLEGAALRLEG